MDRGGGGGFSAVLIIGGTTGARSPRCASRAVAGRWLPANVGRPGGHSNEPVSFPPKISVREAGSETNIALFTPGWMGSGWVVFCSGRRYHLRHTNFGAPNGRSKLRTGPLR